MTKPTITYGHGFLTDCNNATGWVETEDGNVASLTVDHDDWFHIYVTSSGGNKVYYISYPDEAGATNLSLSSTVYTKIFFRYVTGSATVIKAKIVLVFSDATTQTVLAETNTGDHFLTGSTTITSGKIIDHIRLYANGATGNVWYDFALICKDIFTFPNTQYGTEFTPPPRYAMIPIPSRIVDITQNLGSESATFTTSSNLDIGRLSTTPGTCTGDDWKRPQGIDSEYQTDYVKGEVFLDIAHNTVTEPFQWLNTGKQQFKVTLDTLRFPEHSDSHTLDLTFKEYSRSSKSNGSYVERFGLNL